MIRLVHPSIINGSQTQGELKWYFELGAEGRSQVYLLILWGVCSRENLAKSAGVFNPTASLWWNEPDYAVKRPILTSENDMNRQGEAALRQLEFIICDQVTL